MNTYTMKQPTKLRNFDCLIFVAITSLCIRDIIGGDNFSFFSLFLLPVAWYCARILSLLLFTGPLDVHSLG